MTSSNIDGRKELDLIDRIAAWATKNFGTQPAYRPLLGIGEELLHELPLADHDDARKDALADGLIYALNHITLGGYRTEVETLMMSAAFWDSYLAAEFEAATYQDFGEIIGAMNQVQLKHDQQIKKWADPKVYRESMAQLFMCLYFMIDGDTVEEFGESAIDIATAVFDEVEKRDWNKHRAEAQLAG